MMSKFSSILALAVCALGVTAMPLEKRATYSAISSSNATSLSSVPSATLLTSSLPSSPSPTSTTSCTPPKRRRSPNASRSRVTIAKRIAQDTTAAATPWEDACTTAGGGDQCTQIAVTASATLLAAADPCAQQDSADAMVDLAKTLENDAEMIRLAQVFAQQPRNTPTSQAVPYCQKAPKNTELTGLFQCQFQSADQQTFVGGLAVGSPGTVPFGLDAPVSPPGACPASPEGPVPDGLQLADFVKELAESTASESESE